MITDQPALRIRNASLVDGRLIEVWLVDGRLAWTQPDGFRGDVEDWDAEGAAIIPGLNDHHIHVLAAAAALDSVSCGISVVGNRAGLESTLRAAKPRSHGWIRAVDFQPEDLGELTLETLDAWVPVSPLRLQHASGRLWYFNSAGIRALGADAPWESPGRLFDADAWLRSNVPQSLPDVARLSATLGSFGVIGMTDTGPANDLSTLELFRREHQAGRLRQCIQVMGNDSLNQSYRDGEAGAVRVGPLKIHLLESAMPDFDETLARVSVSHAVSRPVAFHCVTRVELVFALAVLAAAGSMDGDRIEHLGLSSQEDLVSLREQGVRVITQPAFLRSKGDRYRREVSEAEWPELYRLASVIDAGVPLAGSSDAPHGPLNPWEGMQAACERRTKSGAILGLSEALTPEQALALYTSDLGNPGFGPLIPRPGEAGNFCLLDQPWSVGREHLSTVRPRLTVCAGRVIWSAKTGTPYG